MVFSGFIKTLNAFFGSMRAQINRSAHLHTPPRAPRKSTLARRAPVARAWQIRSSHRVVDCPGDDDAEPTCARVCAQEHLGFLRAFAVTGARRTPPPPQSPPSYSEPSPPRPPWNPFSECTNACEDSNVLVLSDPKCHDGGKVRLSF